MNFYYRILIAIYALFLSGTLAATAAVDPLDYTLLEPTIQLQQGAPTQTNLLAYLQQIFVSALIMAVFLAILMLVISGVEYIASGVSGAKEDAKKRMFNAFFGLAIALFSWLLLNTIDPSLVELRIEGL